MELHPLGPSSRFPMGYGDLAIQTSDGGVCYFPSSALSEASTVFNGKIQALQARTERGDLTGEITVSESLGLFETFLVHIPNPEILGHEPPHIEAKTIESVLSMSKKYKADIIKEWFEREVDVKPRDQITNTLKDSILTTHPVLVLKLALQYDIPPVIRKGMRELVGSDTKTFAEGSKSILPFVYEEICHRSDSRIVRYLIHIRRLERGKFKAVSRVLQFDERSSLIESYDVTRCASCIQLKPRWIQGMRDAVRERPRWTSFIAAYEANCSCGELGHSLSRHYRGYIDSWKEDALQEEERLPRWPIRIPRKETYLGITFNFRVCLLARSALMIIFWGCFACIVGILLLMWWFTYGDSPW